MLQDERSGAPAVVLITDRFWESAFRRSEDAVGRDVVVDSLHATIVGVLPPDFRLLYSGYSVWMPIHTDEVSTTNRRQRSLLGIARLRRGVTTGQAAAIVSATSARLEHEYPGTNQGWRARVVPMRDFLLAGRGHTLVFLMTALGLLLMVACANVASLQLARASARQREIAIRLALGASRGRIVRFLMVEAGLVAATSGALALALVAAARVVLLASSRELRELTIDLRVLGFTLALAGATAVVFGLMPALTATRVELAAAVKGPFSAQPATRRLRSALVIGELSLSLALLVPSGLLFRSFLALRQTEPGFRVDNLLTFSLAMPAARYSSDPDRRAFSTEVLRQLAEIPGVISGAAADGLPLDPPAVVELRIRNPEEGDGGAGSRTQRAGMRSVTPEYFRTFEIPILYGRAFDSRDATDSPGVAVVNETLARFMRSDRLVAGQRVDAAGQGALTIVGVVADTRSVGLRAAPQPEIFVPLQQRPVSAIAVALATAGGPGSYIPEVRARMRALDRDLPLAFVRPMKEIVDEQTVALRTIAMFLGGLALLALLLATAGISGIMSWLVTLRSHEIGVRRALGASRHDVLVLIMRDALVLAVAGVGLGLPAAVMVARLLSGSLWGVSAADASVFLLVPGILTAVALLAGYGPARRAARLDPAVVLRGM